MNIARFTAVGNDQGLRRWYKGGWVVAIAADKYFQYFEQASQLKILIPGLFQISGSLIIDGLNYVPGIVEYDLIPNTSDLTMAAMGNSTGSFGLPDWTWITRVYPTASLIDNFSLTE